MVFLERFFFRVKVLVEKIGSFWVNNNKILIFFYLFCFIDLLYFIMVLLGSKVIKKFF